MPSQHSRLPLPHLACLIFATLAITQVAAAEQNGIHQQESMLVFTNGNRMSGTIVNLTEDKSSIIWKSPLTEDNLTFPLSKIHRITNVNDITPHPLDNLATINLLGGDSIRGMINALTDESITVMLTDANEINIPLNLVQDISYYASSTILYGIGEGAEWIHSSDTSDAPNGIEITKDRLIFHSNGTVIRNFPNADIFSISFDYFHYHDKPNLAIILLSDDPQDPMNSDFYQLRILNKTVELEKSIPMEPMGRNMPRTQTLGKATFHLHELTQHLHIEIFVNREDRLFNLQINGEHVQTWTNRNLSIGIDNSLGFTIEPPKHDGHTPNHIEKPPQIHSSSTHAISNLHIKRIHEQPSEDNIHPAPEGPNHLNMSNGDLFTGKITNITDGKVIISTTTFGEMPIPTSRISSVALNNNPQPSTNEPNPPNAMLVNLHNGSSFIVIPDSLTNSIIACTTPHFGEISIPMEAIASIECNLHLHKPENIDSPLPLNPAILIDNTSNAKSN